MTPTRKNLVGVLVTLPLADTVYNLLELIKSVEPLCPAAATDLSLQYEGNNTVDIFIGDDQVSPTRYGFKMDSSVAGRTYSRSGRTYPLALVHVRAGAAANQKIAVEVVA